MDYKTRKLATLNLTDNLYNELVFLRKYKELKSQQIKDETRITLDGAYLEGLFIFETSPSGIYYKFSRKFGGLLKDFNITPKDIVILAKQERIQIQDSILYGYRELSIKLGFLLKIALNCFKF